MAEKECLYKDKKNCGIPVPRELPVSTFFDNKIGNNLLSFF